MATNFGSRDHAKWTLLTAGCVEKQQTPLVETQDIALVETQDIALVETRDIALVETSLFSPPNRFTCRGTYLHPKN